MAFTHVTVTGSYTDAQGSPVAGTVTFTLTQAIENDGVLIDPAPVTVTLNETGTFTVVLLANDDTDTVPQGTQYGVTEQIVGAQPRDYFISVPHEMTPVGLASLAPAAPGWD